MNGENLVKTLLHLAKFLLQLSQFYLIWFITLIAVANPVLK